MKDAVPEGAATASAKDPARPVVLVVEDDEIISYLLDFRLRREGFEVLLAKDGRQAAEIIESAAPPRLVLLDVMLPYKDGFELIGQIRSREDWRDVPVIMLTSKAEERNIVRALDAGAADYVVKPFRAEELIARLRRFLR